MLRADECRETLQADKTLTIIEPTVIGDQQENGK